jgi:hypothetical protein
VIEYVEKERALRCNTDAHPGIVCLSSREDHDFGTWVVDREFDPTAHPGGPVPFGKEHDFDSRAVTIDPAELAAELAGVDEVYLVMKMLNDMCHMCVNGGFAKGDFRALDGAMRLTKETAAAIRERWPSGPPQPDGTES